MRVKIDIIIGGHRKDCFFASFFSKPVSQIFTIDAIILSLFNQNIYRIRINGQSSQADPATSLKGKVESENLKCLLS
jgi:hypothetical protein